MGETEWFYLDEITDCDEDFSKEFKVYLDDEEEGSLFVIFSKTGCETGGSSGSGGSSGGGSTGGKGKGRRLLLAN